MRKWIVMLVLALAPAAAAVAESASAQPANPQPSAAGPAGQAATPQHKKEITNPAEYNAYLAAIEQTNPQAKAVSLEGFVQQYPNSVVKEDALELLMATYQQFGNLPKVIDTANRLLQIDPNNLRALALMSYVKRQQAQQGGPAAQPDLSEAQQFGQRGLQALQTAPKPEGMSDADFQKLKTETSTIFNGALGMAALQNKDYPTAQQRLQQSVNINPTNLADVYPLALAYLQAPQPNYLQGIWYLARAASLAAQNPAAQQQIARYGRSEYVKYHGNDQGWDQVVQQAAATPTPPSGFTIQPRPSPAQEAAQLVQTKSVADMSFDEFQLIFTSGNQQAADTVWNQIKDKPIAFAAKVVEARPTKLTLSATAEDIEKNTPDVTVSMAVPISPARLPKVGSMTQVEATPASYNQQPFMIIMTKGALINQGKPAATQRRP